MAAVKTTENTGKKKKFRNVNRITNKKKKKNSTTTTAIATTIIITTGQYSYE